MGINSVEWKYILILIIFILVKKKKVKKVIEWREVGGVKEMKLFWLIFEFVYLLYNEIYIYVFFMIYERGMVKILIKILVR